MSAIVRDSDGVAHLIVDRGKFPKSDCGRAFSGGQRTVTNTKRLSRKCSDCEWGEE